MSQDDLSAQISLPILSKDSSLQYEERNTHIGNTIQPSPIAATTLSTLPPEILFCVMNSLGPREILNLTQVDTTIRLLSMIQLAHVYDIRIRSKCNSSSFGFISGMNHATEPLFDSIIPMSEFELYVRLVLSDLYSFESKDVESTTSRDEVRTALSCCKRILRRLYLVNGQLENFSGKSYEYATNQKHLNNNSNLPKNTGTFPSSTLATLSPYIFSTEYLHIIARILADQVCRGICLPETAILCLQSLTSLWDQDQFQYLVRSSEKHATIRTPAAEDQLSMGQLCFQYLIPNILGLLKPLIHVSTSSHESIGEKQHRSQSSEDKSIRSNVSCSPQLHIQSHLIPSIQPTISIDNNTHNTSTGCSFFDKTAHLTSNVLSTQLKLMQPPRIRSIAHLTRVLVFLPLLGRHFNILPTSTFIETFLDRSKGDLPIDRVAVMVYGFMCVLDLETGKANLASDGYKIFERSMPTGGVVQAQEMVRIVTRYRLLMRGFLLSSPTFSSMRMFGQSNSLYIK